MAAFHGNTYKDWWAIEYPICAHDLKLVYRVGGSKGVGRSKVERKYFSKYSLNHDSGCCVRMGLGFTCLVQRVKHFFDNLWLHKKFGLIWRSRWLEKYIFSFFFFWICLPTNRTLHYKKLKTNQHHWHHDLPYLSLSVWLHCVAFSQQDEGILRLPPVFLGSSIP